ncbi:MAG: hypothetical protein LC804_12230 [Acidobacteria bacterium]|nr:hypothetical protein [Acidobacteriota bacterium]
MTFQDFHEEVARISTVDTAGGQFRLGLALAGVGMITQAIEALKVAAVAPRHRFRAAWQIARLYRGHGMTADSIAWFERAADALPPTAVEGRALLRELGELLRDAGLDARARAVAATLAVSGASPEPVRPATPPQSGAGGNGRAANRPFQPQSGPLRRD